MKEDSEASQEAGPAIDDGTPEIELNALSSIESDVLSSVDEAQAWTDWMQDTDLDPWSCAPCALPSLCHINSQAAARPIPPTAAAFEPSTSKREPD